MFRVTYFIIAIALMMTVMDVSAQYQRFGRMNREKPFPWKDGKRCAVSLTFDDARRSQTSVGMTFLKEHNIRATFYILPNATRRRMELWKQMVSDGHEIGNHTMSHPCTGNAPFSRRNALEEYTLERIEEELDEANKQITEMYGVPVLSFAYPCGNSFVGRGTEVKSYVPLIAKKFMTGRDWLGENTNDPWFCDMAQLQGVESDGKTYEELLNWVQSAERTGRWLVFAGHEINYEGNQTTLVPELEKLFDYMNDEENGIWVDTVGNIAQHVLEVRETEKENESSESEN